MRLGCKSTIVAAAAIALGGFIGLPAWGASSSGVEVSEAVRHDVSRPMRDLPIQLFARTAPRVMHRPFPIAPAEAALGAQAARTENVLQTQAGALLATTNFLNFDGVGNGAYGFTPAYAPPDTVGAVGGAQYVQWVNTSFAVFDKKTGALLLAPVPGNALWAGFGGGCESNNDGDVIVQYDKIAKRWILSQFAISTTPFLECVAVSQSSDATGAYYRYAFNYGPNRFNDYPKMGVWPDAYYITYNIFSANGDKTYGALVCALDRASMLAGSAARQQCFQLKPQYEGVLPADLDGTVLPPPGSPNYMVDLGKNSLNLWRFHVDWAAPANTTLTGPINIAVPAFTLACGDGSTCIPQPNTTNPLDSLGDRLMYRLAYRVVADNEFTSHESLVVNHSIAVDGKVGVRWYELRSPAGPVTLYQSGTFATGILNRWMGSIAMDKNGDIALGYSASGAAAPQYPSIRYTGRLPTDPLGRMKGETVIWHGHGSQVDGLTRWGDYSAMTIDPEDDCTFWYTNEYLPRTGSYNWKTRIASFKFPNCQ